MQERILILNSFYKISLTLYKGQGHWQETKEGEGAWTSGLWRCKASVSQWSERPWVRVPEWR